MHVIIPGLRKKGSAIIGDPIEAKFGATREQIFRMYEEMKAGGVKRFGIHTMVASNCLNPEYLIDTADMLFDLILEIKKRVGITMEFANLGGGFGIPYRPNENPLDIGKVARGVKKSHDRFVRRGHPPVRLSTENGRWVTGPHGYLVTRATQAA